MNRYTRILIQASLLLSLVLFVSIPAFAQQTDGGTTGGQTDGGTTGGQTDGGSANCTGLCNPLKGIDTLPQFLHAILDGVVQIGTIVLIMMLVYVGFLFVAARGNPEKIQGAKSALVWTVIGGLVLLGATAIELVIEGTVNSITN